MVASLLQSLVLFKVTFPSLRGFVADSKGVPACFTGIVLSELPPLPVFAGIFK